MNVLITGANGFLGRAISDSDLFRSHKIFKISSSEGDQRTLQIDIKAEESVSKIVDWLGEKKIDVIFHFAAVTPFHDKSVDFANDLKIAKNVTTLCNRLKIPKLVHSSGWIVYSPQSKTPISENAPLGPITDYGKSKLHVENYFKNSLEKTTLLNLRLASVYGPGQKSKGLIPNLINSALESHEMKINSLDTKRDYLYIGDFVKGCSDIMKYNGKNIDINIGSGNSHRVEDVAKIIRDIFQEEFGITVFLKVQKPVIESEPLDNILDITRAKKMLGFYPEISLKKGLLCLIKSLKNQ